MIYDRGHNGGNIWRWQTIAKWCNEYRWKTGAELGTWEGNTFKYLINHCPDLTLIGVDLYEAQPDNTGPEKWTPGENGHVWNHSRYYQDIMDFCAANAPRAVFHKGFTNDVAKLIPDESLDFVFIDADHSFKGVDDDITNWSPKVKSNGFIIGHDIHFDSVREAVEKHYGDKYNKTDDFVWYVIK